MLVSLPRILELLMALFEDVVFIKKRERERERERKKETKRKNIACFFKTKIFSFQKLYEKREGFVWADEPIF